VLLSFDQMFFFQRFVTTHTTSDNVRDIESAANAMSAGGIVITNRVAKARRYTLTAFIAGHEAARKVRPKSLVISLSAQQW
jgi:hypothetical protein